MGSERVISDGEAQEALNLLREMRQDLFDRWIDIEKNGRSIDNIRGDTINFLREFHLTQKARPGDLTEFRYFSAMRKLILISLGLWLRGRKFSEDEITLAVSRLKKDKPETWSKWREHEMKDEGFSDIAGDIMDTVRGLSITNNLVEMTDLIREIQKVARAELGLWV